MSKVTPNITFRVVNIEFAKKPKSKKIARFAGTIQILIDEFDIIYDLKVSLSECWLDLCTTKAWLVSKTKNRNLKERLGLAKKLGYELKPREKTSEHELIKLNKEQLEITSEYFNKSKDTTLKNLITLIKGSNPSGEASKPSAAELLAKKKGSWVPFSLLIKNLRVKKPERIYHVDSILSDNNVKVISFNDWVENSEFIKIKHKILCNPKNPEEYKCLCKDFKKWVSEYTQIVVDVQSIIEKNRSRFSENIDKFYSLTYIFKSFNYDFREGYEFAHIKAVHKIKNEIRIELQNNEESEKKIQDLCSQISDPENFLPLPSRIHKIYDKNQIAFDLEGKITKTSNDLNDSDYQKLYNELKKHKLDKIPNEWYTSKRKYYIKEHWNNIKKT